MEEEGIKQQLYFRCQNYCMCFFPLLNRMTPKEIMKEFCWLSVEVITNPNADMSNEAFCGNIMTQVVPRAGMKK